MEPVNFSHDIFHILSTILGVIIVVVNCLIIITISKVREKTPTHILITGLSAADLVLGISIVISRIFVFVQPTGSNIKWCFLVILTVYYSTTGISCLSHLAIGTDRFCAVVHPGTYKVKVTKKRCCIFIGISWIYCTLIILICLFHFGKDKPMNVLLNMDITRLVPVFLWFSAIFPNLTLTLLVTIVLYFITFYHIHKNQRRVSFKKSGYCWNRSAVRVTKLMLILLTMFSLCWTPYGITAAAKIVIENPPLWIHIGFRVSVLLLYANSFMNTLIYAYKSQEIRNVVEGMLTCFSGDMCQNQETSVHNLEMEGQEQANESVC